MLFNGALFNGLRAPLGDAHAFEAPISAWHIQATTQRQNILQACDPVTHTMTDLSLRRYADDLNRSHTVTTLSDTKEAITISDTALDSQLSTVGFSQSADKNKWYHIMSEEARMDLLKACSIITVIKLCPVRLYTRPPS